jgi:hypothetical protein
VALYPEGRPDPRIETSRGRIDLPGQNVLTLVCAEVGGMLCLAGSGQQDDHAWLWNGAQWMALCPTYGTSPCAFGPDGTLYVSGPGTVDNVRLFEPLTGRQVGAHTQVIGARGIASVDALGIHPQDAWYGQHGLGEYVEVDGYRIGQGIVHDGLKAADYGMLIPSGLCQFNRVHKAGDQFATASWLSAEGRTVLLWPTVADLSTLPPEAPPDPPDPGPTPPDPIEPGPEPPKPIPAHGFNAPPTYRIEGHMLSEKGGIVGAGGKYGRMGPMGSSPVGNWRLVIFDGDSDQGNYEFTLTETTPGRGVAQDTATGSYVGQDIAVGDLTQCAYGKPDAPGGYETPYLFGPVAGVRFLWVPQNPDDAVKVPFGCSILTWVPRKA